MKILDAIMDWTFVFVLAVLILAVLAIVFWPATFLLILGWVCGH